MASSKWSLSWGYWKGFILPSLPLIIVLEDLKTALGISHRAIAQAYSWKLSSLTLSPPMVPNDFLF